MTLIDLYGEDSFYHNIDGKKIKRYSKILPQGELYLQDDELRLINDGQEKTIARHVGVWKLIGEGHIIYNFSISEEEDFNFIIIDLGGNIIKSGIVCNEGLLIYREENNIYSEEINGKRKCIIPNINPECYFHYTHSDNEIHLRENFAETDFNYDKVYSSSGKFMPEKTRKLFLLYLFVSIIRMLSNDDKLSFFCKNSLTEEQRKKYIPKILNAEEVWCQGYSEPNAGSDLSALKTNAVKQGDKWIIWSTHTLTMNTVSLIK